MFYKSLMLKIHDKIAESLESAFAFVGIAFCFRVLGSNETLPLSLREGDKSKW